MNDLFGMCAAINFIHNTVLKDIRKWIIAVTAQEYSSAENLGLLRMFGLELGFLAQFFETEGGDSGPREFTVFRAVVSDDNLLVGDDEFD